jgi:hypothetical protein
VTAELIDDDGEMLRQYVASPDYIANIKAKHPDRVKVLTCATEGCEATVAATHGQILFGFVPGWAAYGKDSQWHCGACFEEWEALDEDELDEDDEPIRRGEAT